MSLNDLRLPKDLILKRGVKILVYGGAGSCKTRACATTTQNSLFVAVENGILSIKDCNIPVLDCRPVGKDSTQAYTHSITQFTKFMSELKQGVYDKFDTIIIDSLSELVTNLLNVELTKVKDDRQAYGAINDKILAWIDELDQVKHNVILICKQELITLGSGTNAMLFARPQIEGKALYTKLTHKFDGIFRFQLKRLPVNGKVGEYLVISTKNQPDYIARDRSGTLPDDVPQDLQSVINAMKSAQ